MTASRARRVAGGWLGLALAIGGASGAAGASGDPPSRFIVPQQGMAGVRIGMRPNRVRRILGRPDRRVTHFESGTGRSIRYWRYRASRLEAGFRLVRGRFRLLIIGTRSGDFATRELVRVGTEEAALREKLPRADCGPTDPGEIWCTLGGYSRGKRQTVFRLWRGRVREITILVIF